MTPIHKHHHANLCHEKSKCDGHSHNANILHLHSHQTQNSNMLVAFLLNASFVVFEIVGGIATGSSAILSDAVHDFGDSLVLGISLVLKHFSCKPPTKQFSYGFKRIAVLGAMLNLVVLLVGSVVVAWQAINRFLHPQAVLAQGMFGMAIFGILVNGISVLRMKDAKNVLDRSVALHLLEDLLGWISVFVVSIAIYVTKWNWLDPLLSLFICLVILKNIWKTGKTILQIVMQAAPDTELLNELEAEFLAIEGVVGVRRLQMWTQDGEEHVLTAQIQISQMADASCALQATKHILEHKGIVQSTIELCV